MEDVYSCFHSPLMFAFLCLQVGFTNLSAIATEESIELSFRFRTHSVNIYADYICTSK